MPSMQSFPESGDLDAPPRDGREQEQEQIKVPSMQSLPGQVDGGDGTGFGDMLFGSVFDRPDNTETPRFESIPDSSGGSHGTTPQVQSSFEKRQEVSSAAAHGQRVTF